MVGSRCASSPTAICSLIRAMRGMIGCSAEELDITTETPGSSPAVIAIMNAQEPWQWMTALMASADVRARTSLTAAGMSSTRRVIEGVFDGR